MDRYRRKIAHVAPIGLHIYATNFIDAAGVAPDVNNSFAPAKTYLACHAIELLLKAFLVTKGTRLKEVAQLRGHDLNGLMEDAECEGLSELIEIPSRMKAEILKAATYYREKVIQYPAVWESVHCYRHWPATEPLIDAADLLAKALYEECLHSDIKRTAGSQFQIIAA